MLYFFGYFTELVGWHSWQISLVRRRWSRPMMESQLRPLRQHQPNQNKRERSQFGMGRRSRTLGVNLCLITKNHSSMLRKNYVWCSVPPTSRWVLIFRGAEGPGREILKHPPSVTFSFCTVTRKHIAVFSQNFAGMCTMSWGCAV